MVRTLWTALRAWIIRSRRWLAAFAGAASVVASLTALVNAKAGTCGTVALVPCIVESASDLYRMVTTRSCDARISPGIKARHRQIAKAHAHNDKWQSWLADSVPLHQRLLLACRLAKSSAGPAATAEEACAKLRESGHLILLTAPPQWTSAVLAATERELDCTYDRPSGEAVPTAHLRS